MNIEFLRNINKQVKIFDIPIGMFLVCIGLIFIIIFFSDTIKLMFNVDFNPNYIYAIIFLILLSGRFLPDSYFTISFFQKLILRKNRTKILKTPKL